MIISATRSGDIRKVVYSFAGMSNLHDSETIDTDTNLCANLVNMDCVSTYSTVRQGSELTLAGAAHSGWSDGVRAYCVKAGQLALFDGVATTAIMPANNRLPMSYARVNNLVVATNGQDYVVIDSGVASVAQPASDPRKVAPMPGSYVVYYNGRVYTALENVLSHTDPFTVDSSDIDQMFIPVTTDPITGLCAVDDGIYVGTTTECLFLRGSDPVSGGFELVQVTPYGVVPRSMIQGAASKLKIATGARGLVAAWLSTTEGVCIGSNGGSVTNVSNTTNSIPEVATAASAIRELNGSVHFVVVTGAGTQYNAYTPQTFEQLLEV